MDDLEEEWVAGTGIPGAAQNNRPFVAFAGTRSDEVRLFARKSADSRDLISVADYLNVALERRASVIFGKAGTPVAFIYVKDRESALRFYLDLLELELRSSDDFGDFLAAGGALVRMTTIVEHEAGPHPVFGWDVPDITAAAKKLRDCGVRLAIYEGMGQDELGIWTSPDGATKVAWFRDPAGNVLSLSQT